MNRKICASGFQKIACAVVLLTCAVVPYAENQTDGDTSLSETTEESPVVIDKTALPIIEKFSHKDPAFFALEELRAANDMAAARGKEQRIEFYAYAPQKDDNLFIIASATGIPYDTIATLNGISGSKSPLEGRRLVIPSAKGLFVFAEPESELEILCAKEADSTESAAGTFSIDGRETRFFLGRRFTSTQRAFFLDSSIRMPLKKAVVSSAFGYRVSPVYGRWKFHKGIDLAAPEGEPVFACKSGTVSLCVHGNAIFGNYIVINHGGGMTSTYAHLSQIRVKKGDSVNGGAIIGNVGKTGAATGSHLHFEIRLNGAAQDPAKLLPLD
ncbi:MAG: LysM peptidoglycan-binding domain-containing M23 family metallopeptidase [Treponema sp.]